MTKDEILEKLKEVLQSYDGYQKFYSDYAIGNATPKKMIFDENDDYAPDSPTETLEGRVESWKQQISLLESQIKSTKSIEESSRVRFAQSKIKTHVKRKAIVESEIDARNFLLSELQNEYKKNIKLVDQTIANLHVQLRSLGDNPSKTDEKKILDRIEEERAKKSKIEQKYLEEENIVKTELSNYKKELELLGTNIKGLEEIKEGYISADAQAIEKRNHDFFGRLKCNIIYHNHCYDAKKT